MLAVNFQVGIGRAGRARWLRIRHRIVGGIEAFGGGILQPLDDALGAGRSTGPACVHCGAYSPRWRTSRPRARSALRSKTRQRLAAEHFAPIYRRRLMGPGTLLAALTGSLAGQARAPCGRRRCGVVVAVSLFGVSLLDASAGLDSAAGAVTISAGFRIGRPGWRCSAPPSWRHRRRGRGVHA